jgi:hypothetical protein
VRVRCSCGREQEICTPFLKLTNSCRVCGSKRGHDARTKHGFSRQKERGGKHHPLYVAWRGMLARTDGTHGVLSRRWYLDKGIIVCEAWKDFRAFRNWALANGYREGLTLDRIFSWRGYAPSNCEWITRSENTRRARQDIWRRYETCPIEMLWGSC